MFFQLFQPYYEPCLTLTKIHKPKICAYNQYILDWMKLSSVYNKPGVFQVPKML